MSDLIKYIFTKKNGKYIDNVADILTEDQLNKISARVSEQYLRDEESCRDKLTRISEALRLANMTALQRNQPWSGSSNVVYPILSSAAINIAANLYPDLVRDKDIVKPEIIGNDDGKISKFNGAYKMDDDGKYIKQGAGDKLARGNRACTMLNWQLSNQISWWKQDEDRKATALPIVGTMYKKVYYSSLLKQPVSELIFPDKIIVNNNCRDLDSATVSEIILLYPQEVMQRIRSGYFIEYNFDPEAQEGQVSNSGLSIKSDETDNTEHKDNTHRFIEQHTWLDLDEDGFLEPWIITATADQFKVVRVVPRFSQEGIKYNAKSQIEFIEAKQFYVAIKFMPSFDGSFFGTSLADLLLNLNLSVNTTLNQMFDAGSLSITGCGLISSNIKFPRGKFTVSPNEWLPVQNIGINIANEIYKMPTPEPSQTLFALLGFLTNAGERLGMINNVLQGENVSNMAATTFLGLVDQGTKQFRSIFLRISESLKQEFKLLYNLNCEYLTKKEYAKVIDDVPEELLSVKHDFAPGNYQIVPVADVNSIVSLQKYANANFLMQFMNDPYVDGLKLRQRIFETARIQDSKELLIQPQPQPNPAIEIEQMRLQAKMAEIDSRMQLNNQKVLIDTEKAKADIEKTHTASLVDLATVAEKTKKTDLAEQSEQVKIYDNIINAEVAAAEIQDRREHRELQTKLKLMDMIHDGKGKLADHEHKKEMLDLQNNYVKNNTPDTSNEETELNKNEN